MNISDTSQLPPDAPFSAVIKHQGDWWIGWLLEIPGVNGQERTREDVIESLRIGLREMLAFNRHEARTAVDATFSVVAIGL